MKIFIPKHDSVPETTLYAKIVSASNHETKNSKIFILPGGPGCDSTSYTRYSCLKEVGDVIFHDPRGTGKSPVAEYQHCTMDNYIDDVDYVRRHLNLDKVVILGKSYGSMAALGYALRYPNTLDKLILSAGAPSYRFIETAKENLHKLGSSDQIKISEKLWNGSFSSQDEIDEYLYKLNPLYSLTNQSAKKDDFVNCINVNVLNLGFQTFLQHFDFESELHRIKCPTLILSGAKDWVNDPKYAKLMANGIPNSTLHMFENSSHAMETDAQDEYFSVIKQFIRENL